MKIVSNFFKTYQQQVYTSSTWLIIKVIWFFYFNNILINHLNQVNSIASPSSICNYLPCSFLLNTNIILILKIAIIVLGILYILEKLMIPVLFILSLLSIIICSTIDSSGVLFRLAGFSLIMIVQFIAYTLHYKNPDKYNLNQLRIHFSLQIIASLYTLSFTSKLASSGILWFIQTEGFSKHVLKSWLYYYVSSGEEHILNKGYFFYNFIQNYPLLIAVGLAIAMFLEGFSFLTIFNPKLAFYWGLGLLSMHVGIYILMDISIYSIVLPMLLFMLNLPAVLTTIIILIKSKST